MGVCVSKSIIGPESVKEKAFTHVHVEEELPQHDVNQSPFNRISSASSTMTTLSSSSKIFNPLKISNKNRRGTRQPSFESVTELQREDGMTDEEWDDLQVVRILFDEIDENKNGSLSKEEMESYLIKNHKNEEICQVLLALTKSCEDIEFKEFRDAVRQIPRVIGQRVTWVGTLNFASELAKHLKPGTIFDGLKGIREEMTKDDIKKACSKFCEAVPELVIRGWEELSQRRRQVKAEDVNSKFAMGEEAVKGSFGTLDDFYTGPEARLGHPNPKLYEAMEREHTRRANAMKLFTTPNYLVTTCTLWEWHWVVDPRMALNVDIYPGEIGDTFSETNVTFDVECAAGKDAEDVIKCINTDMLAVLSERLCESLEEKSKGIRLLEPPKDNKDCVSTTVALPFSESQLDAQALKDMVALLVKSEPEKVCVRRVVENRFEYTEFVEEAQLETALLSKSKSKESIRLYLERIGSWNPNESLETCIRSAIHKFLDENAEWNAQNKFRKQGRIRQQGTINNFISQQNVQDVINRANLRKEEVIALRLYTGPNYLLYNAALRGFPQSIVELLSANRMETTIFVITSGLVKLAKVTEIPRNRFLYRGLGGMLLPEEFWKPASQLQGGVELGLMSTTVDKRVAIQYSGFEKKRATIFEIMAGRIDIGGSLSFLSQYPGEAEYLMPPLTCLEVMGRPRVEMTDKGEVIVFPMRANINLKSMTVEQLENRRKELHLAFVTNLQEELFQGLETVEAEAENFLSSEQLQDPMIAAVVKSIKDEFRSISSRHHALQPQNFNHEKTYKELMVEAIDAKVFAMSKISFFFEELKETKLFCDKHFLQRILDTPFREFDNKGIELQLRTGIKNFPWQDVIAQKPSIDLGDWSPLGLEPWKLDETRKVLAQNNAIRGVTIKRHVIPFQQGILAEDINLDNQPVTGVAAELGFLLSVNTSLSRLSLRGNELTCAEWAQILGALQECKLLSRINGGDFSNALLQDQVELDLRGREIDREGAAVVGGLLIRSASTLTALNLSFNKISKEGGTIIAEGLTYVSGLQKLNLSYNGLSKEGADAIALSLLHLTALVSLNLRSNDLGKEGGTAIANGLHHVSLLEYLDLQGNDLSAEGGKAIAYALEYVTNLKSLDISSNRLTKEGGSVIATYLRYVPNLEILNLSSNGLSKDGGNYIAEDLQHISQLQVLDLHGNELGKEGAAAIAKSLRHVRFLQFLDIRLNNISKEGGTTVAEGLENVQYLQSLLIASNALAKEGVTAIARSLHFVTMLRTLDLSWNEIGNEGALAVAEALRISPLLSTLDLRFNRLDDDGVEWRIRNKLTAVKNLMITNLIQVQGPLPT